MIPEHAAQRLDNWSWRSVATLSARRWLATVMLLIVCCLAYLPGLTVLPAIDRTEGVVALSSRQVVESGDYLRPRWGDNIQRTRPAGTFWLQALSLLAHPSERWDEIAAYRLPSMIATTAAVLLMFWIGSALVGGAAALIASIALAVTPIVTLHAQLAIAEPLVLPATVVAGLALLAIYQDASAARWRGWLGAFWVMLGVSTWFNALAVPLLALVIALVITATDLRSADRRPVLMWRLQPWYGIPLLAVLALPWLAAVAAIDAGMPYRGMNVRELLDALEGGQSMKFKTAYGVFILTLAIGFIPVAHMLGPAVTRLWPERNAATVRLLLVWLIAPIIALEIFSNKPPLYTVQAVMPAGALLVGLVIARGSAHAHTIRAWPGMFWATAVLLGLLAPALFVGILWVTETPLSPLIAIGYLAFAGLFLVAAWVSVHGYAMAWFTTAIAGTFLFGLWFHGALMPGLRNFWTAPQIARVTERLANCSPDAATGQVRISGFREPSLALAVAGHAHLVSAEAAGASLAAPGRRYAIIESRDADAFKAAYKAAGTKDGAANGSLRDLGCIRSINLARGCALTFTVYGRAPQSGDETCRTMLPATCEGRHEVLMQRLKIKHCQ
ncbi:MAG: hypothetical protein KKB37_05440 [Alphaproteobacteria bacterium]|nr:hypothetical protein [Alphaproteobacteria bacterium]